MRPLRESIFTIYSVKNYLLQPISTSSLQNGKQNNKVYNSSSQILLKYRYVHKISMKKIKFIKKKQSKIIIIMNLIFIFVILTFMKKTFFGVSLLSAIGLVTFLNFGTIKVDNHSLGSIMRYFHSKNPQYSLKLFQKLNQYQLLSQSQSTRNIFVGSGIDIEGRLTEGLSKAGFSGEQIGPISLQPSTKQQKITHLGLNYARSKLISYKLNNPSKQFIIGFNILPDLQILKVAPYLLKQNVINQFQAIEPNLNVIDFITVNLAHQNVQKYMGNYLFENEALLIEIFSSISQKIQKNQTENRCEVYLQTQKSINLEPYKKITHQNSKYKYLHKSSWQQIFNALYNTK